MINNTMMAFGYPGWQELLVLAVILMLMFGAKKMPQMARGLGESIREFKKIGKDIKETGNDVKKDLNETKDNLKEGLS